MRVSMLEAWDQWVDVHGRTYRHNPENGDPKAFLRQSPGGSWEESYDPGGRPWKEAALPSREAAGRLLRALAAPTTAG